MRITYRRKNNKDYWTQRWENIPADLPMKNLDAYPLKYAGLTIQNKDGKILEAGCGAGRVLRYYHDRGYDIVGMDFIEGAITKLKEIDPSLNVETGDITNLQYGDNSFKYILAFGLYHNFEHGLDKAIQETYRVLQTGGKVCASFRADNIQTRLTDWLTEYRAKKAGVDSDANEFHKMNLTRSEFINLFKRNGFQVESIFPVENMPILYKFRLFRSRDHKNFNENKARKDGYQLSFMGKIIQKFIMKFFPDNFCNIFVLVAQKPVNSDAKC